MLDIPPLGISRSSAASVVAFAFLAVAGCLEPPVDVQRLPDNVLEKRLFDPNKEWLFQRTITNASYSSQFFVGDSEYSERVKFIIQENYLIVARAHPYVNTDDPFFQGINQVDAPLAVYAIRAHADVENGQIVQRPKSNWYDQKYFIVDLSNDLLVGEKFAPFKAKEEPVAYWVSRPNDSESPRFTADYIDFITHQFFDPRGGINAYTGREETCLSVDNLLDCASNEVVYRTAFLRIDNAPRYEPMRFEDEDFSNTFPSGAFFMSRVVHPSSDYQQTIGNSDAVADRFDIWEQSYDDAGDLIPYADRTVRPVVIHVSDAFPETAIPPLQLAVDGWDGAFLDTVRALRAHECVDQGGEEDACFDEAEVPDHVVLLCPHNPVREDDDRRCGPPGTVARLGDLRFNLIQWVLNPTLAQPMAVAWWSPDPLTGQTFHADVKVAPASVERGLTSFAEAVFVASGRQALISDVDELRTLRALPVREQDALRTGASAAQTSPTTVSDRATAFAPLIGTPLERAMLDPNDLLVRGEFPEDGITPIAPTPETSPLRLSYFDSALRPDDGVNAATHVVDAEIPEDLDLSLVAAEFSGLSVAEMRDRLRPHFLQWVFTHELGHVFALRHNFAGSSDALNYRPEYWALRRRDCGPRWECPYTQAERDGKLSAYEVGSTMDYYSAISFVPGVGYFDRAAIAALYGKLTTVFNRPGLADDDDAFALATAMRSARPLPIPIIAEADPSRPEGYRYRGVHYSRYPDVFGDLSERRLVPTRRLARTSRPVSDDQGRLVVSFLACDNNSATSPGCRSFDAGADAYEQVVSATRRFQTYRLVDSFRRGRTFWNPSTVASATASRYFRPLREWNDELAWLAINYATLQPDALEDPDLFLSMVKASEVSLQFFGEVLATPEAGAHIHSAAYDGADAFIPPETRIFQAAVPPPEDVYIPMPAGMPYTSFLSLNPSFGGVDNLGSFVTKQYAIEALFEPSGFDFGGRDSWEQGEMWMVNFASTHRAAVLRLIGAIIADDWRGFSARMDADGALQFPDYLTGVEPAAGIRVSPAVGYNLRLRALGWSLALMIPRVADRAAFDTFRIFQVGAPDEVTSTTPRVEYVDPSSGATLAAFSFVVDGEETGIGARVLNRLVELDALKDDTSVVAEVAAVRARAYTRQLELAKLVRATVWNYESQLLTDP